MTSTKKSFYEKLLATILGTGWCLNRIIKFMQHRSWICTPSDPKFIKLGSPEHKIHMIQRIWNIVFCLFNITPKTSISDETHIQLLLIWKIVMFFSTLLKQSNSDTTHIQLLFKRQTSIIHTKFKNKKTTYRNKTKHNTSLKTFLIFPLTS